MKPTETPRQRHARGRTRGDATFPVAPSRAELPIDYVATLADIKQRASTQRLRVVTAANAAMVELCWDIGRTILDRQVNAGWGAKIIDRLSADLRAAYPDMQGFSPRNLKYNLYLSATDDLLRHPDDKPTIGLLLCRSKHELVVEYALRDLGKPIGVARWATQLVETLPAELEGSLPTVAQIEAELGEGEPE